MRAPERPETERLRALDNLELFDATPVIVVLLDPVGIIQHVNAYFEQLTGYHLDELQGKDWFSTLLPDRYQVRVRELLTDVTTAKDLRDRYVNPIVTRGGEERQIEWSNRTLRDTSGKVTGFLVVGLDVTEGALREQQLADSEARLIAAQRLAKIGSWELDHVTGKLCWSDTIYELFEIDTAGFGATYEAFLNVIHPDDRQSVDEAYTGSLVDLADYAITHRLLMPDGRIKWVEEQCSTDFAADGTPLVSRGTVQDVTDIHAWAEELRLFKQSLDRTLDSVFIIDRESLQYIYANLGAAEGLGYTQAELLQMRSWDIKPEFTEVQFRELIAPLLAGAQQQLRFDTVHRHRDGHLIPVSVSLQYVEPMINAGRFVSVVHDITDRKNTENTLHHLNEQLEVRAGERAAELAERQLQLEQAQQLAHIGTWSADLQTGESVWSDEMFRIFGRDRTTFTPNIDTLKAAIHPDDREQLWQLVNDATDGLDGFAADRRIVLPDGSSRWVRDTGKLERDADGRPVRLTGTIQDITERKGAEQELVVARDQAERANRAKTKFLSHISHELRTPLNAVLGFAQLLKIDTLTSDQTESVDEILRAGEHLHDMVNQMLDLAMIESNDLTIDIEQVALRPLAEACIDIVAPLAAERGISITTCFVDEGAVFADPNRLRQVVDNLLSNAVKYNNRGGTIELRCHSEHQRVRISVHDNGIGIAPEAMERLFAPFEQIEPTYTGRSGAGIGLALCRRLITAMHGSIEVESELGSGTTVSLELPEVPGPGNTANTANTAITTPDTSPRTELRTELRTVLCVEDNPTSMRLLERILLPSSGFETIEASRGDTVADLARQHQPDIILLDIGLPDIDGHEVLRRLRADPLTRQIPVVALTADAMFTNTDRLEQGFAAYVTKPFKVQQLVDIIEHYSHEYSGT